MNTTHETTYSKDRDGHCADTSIPLCTLPSGKVRTLTINTSKGSRGLGTYAQVVEIAEDGGLSFVLHQDFRKSLDNAAPGTRCTEKNVKLQHAAVLVNVEALIAEAKAYYEKKDQERASFDDRNSRGLIDRHMTP